MGVVADEAAGTMLEDLAAVADEAIEQAIRGADPRASRRAMRLHLLNSQKRYRRMAESAGGIAQLTGVQP